MYNEDFKDRFNSILERANLFSTKGLREGLLALEDHLNENEILNKDNIFEFGMRLVFDGVDPVMIEKILTNIVNLEEKKEEKILKIIQKEAVLGIEERLNTRLLLLLLNSYVNIGIEEALKKYLD
jgi:flagellar motor component MotA